MSFVRSAANHRLRFNHRGGADADRQLRGVIFEQRIPGGVTVFIAMDQPSELPQSDAIIQSPLLGPASNSAVKFAVEAAARPLVTAAAGGVTFRNRVRVLSAGGALPNGQVVVTQVEPAWAALSIGIPAGGLVLKGRYSTSFVMPVDPNGDVPNSGIRPAGQLLRVRWLGTAAAGVVLGAGTGVLKTFALNFAATGLAIAPGSVVLTATIGGAPLTIRDTGDGRLVGQIAGTPTVYATGLIDYVAGTGSLVFSTAPDNSTNITGNFEHTTKYLPLDVDLEWDALVQ